MPISIPPRALLATLALAVAARLPAQQAASAPVRDTAPARDTTPPAGAVTPAPDQARGVEAELRAGLFELVTDRPLTALDRLEGLRAMGDSAVSPAARTELSFLLAESYYRLGMSREFQTAAAALGTQVPARYAELLGVQRMVDAYRQGADTLVRQLAAQVPAGSTQPLAAMLAGLSAYRMRDWTAARDAFAAVRAAGGPYAPYAQYMSALALLGGDTAQAGPALDTLRSLAGVATGRFGDQVRLAAAQLAYQTGHYDAAASFADAVAPSGGLGADALLTRAWALYRGGKLADAGPAFARFAAQYPDLPERDAARLMVGQVMLEQGQTAEAGRYLATLADSMGAESALVQGRANGALTDAARALVQARLAGVVFLPDVRSGATLVLPDDAGADASTLLAAVAGTPAPPLRDGPDVLSLDALRARLDSLGPRVDLPVARRLVFVDGPSASTAGWAGASQALASADVSVALARYRLQEQLDAQAMRIAAMEAMQKLIAHDDTVLAAGASVLTALQDSLTRMDAVLGTARARIHAMLTAQAQSTAEMAARNASIADSLRTSLEAHATPGESSTLQLESQTAAIYARIASEVGAGVDGAIARSPAFARRDSIAARLTATRALHDDALQVLAADSVLAAGALVTLRGGDSERARAMRAALAAAEAQRATTESGLVTMVDGELRSRATALLAALQRQRERAAYGSASAAFFQAMEAAGAGGTPAPASAAGPPPRR